MGKAKLKITEQDLNEMLSHAYNAGYLNRKFDEQEKKKKKKKSSCECTGSCHKEMNLKNPVARVIHISSPEDMENFLNQLKEAKLKEFDGHMGEKQTEADVAEETDESTPGFVPTISFGDDYIGKAIDGISSFLSSEESIPANTIIAFIKPGNNSCIVHRVTPGENGYTGVLKTLTSTVIDSLNAIREISDGEE